MNSLVTIVAALLAMGAAVVRSQEEWDEEAIDRLLCSGEQRESILECMQLVPDSHIEIMKRCDTRLNDVGNDRCKLLEYYCLMEDGSAEESESEQCVTEAYRSRGMSELEPIRGTMDCLQKMVTVEKK